MNDLKRRGWVWIWVLGLMGIGCGEEQSVPIGPGLLEGQGMGNVITLEPIPAQRDTTYQIPALLGGGQPFIGRTDGLEAGLLVRFTNLPGGAVVQSADLELYALDLYGDPVDGLEATMYEIQSGWEEGDRWDEGLPAYREPPVAQIPFGAVVPDTTTIPLPASLVQSWTDTTTDVDHFGLLILPPPDATFLKRFEQVVLRLTYQATSVSDTTTQLFLPSAQAFYVHRFGDLSALTNANDGLVIADGDIYRSLVYFSIPDTIDSMATVNSARLEADVRMDTSFTNTMRIEAWRLPDGGWDSEVLPSLDLGEIGISTSSATTIADTSSMISLEIRDIVQAWIRDPTSNHGLLLRSFRERQDINALFLRAPRLSILYSKPPEVR